MWCQKRLAELEVLCSVPVGLSAWGHTLLETTHCICTEMGGDHFRSLLLSWSGYPMNLVI